jgi:hypothetical protein
MLSPSHKSLLVLRSFFPIGEIGICNGAISDAINAGVMDGRGDLLRALKRTPGYVQLDDVGRLLSRSQEAVVSSAPPSRLGKNWGH